MSTSSWVICLFLFCTYATETNCLFLPFFFFISIFLVVEGHPLSGDTDVPCKKKKRNVRADVKRTFINHSKKKLLVVLAGIVSRNILKIEGILASFFIKKKKEKTVWTHHLYVFKVRMPSWNVGQKTHKQTSLYNIHLTTCQLSWQTAPAHTNSFVCVSVCVCGQ